MYSKTHSYIQTSWIIKMSRLIPIPNGKRTILKVSVSVVFEISTTDKPNKNFKDYKRD